MAITGSGTQQSPWVVHNYNELKTVIYDSSYLPNLGAVKGYIKLGNNIDCNDYGTTFEWDEISVRDNSNNFEFNLDGHTIKNFKVKTDKVVFKVGTAYTTTIKNGKILNAYLSNSKGFIEPMGGVYAFPQLEDMSISINTGNGITNNALFTRTGVKRCAIYVEGTLPDSTILHTKNSEGGTVEDSDFLLNISSLSYIDNFDAGLGNIKRCRFRGIVAHSSSDCLLKGGAEYSVIDVTTDAHYSSYNYGTQNALTVINKTKAPQMSYFQDMLQATSDVVGSRITVGADLRSLGFDVVNV